MRAQEGNGVDEEESSGEERIAAEETAIKTTSGLGL